MSEVEDPPPSFEGTYLIDNVVVDENAGAAVFKCPMSRRWKLSITGHHDTIHYMEDLSASEPDTENGIKFQVNVEEPAPTRSILWLEEKREPHKVMRTHEFRVTDEIEYKILKDAIVAVLSQSILVGKQVAVAKRLESLMNKQIQRRTFTPRPMRAETQRSGSERFHLLAPKTILPLCDDRSTPLTLLLEPKMEPTSTPELLRKRNRKGGKGSIADKENSTDRDIYKKKVKEERQEEEEDEDFDVQGKKRLSGGKKKIKKGKEAEVSEDEKYHIPPVDETRDGIDYFGDYFRYYSEIDPASTITENYCFLCKDGGDLVECDHSAKDKKKRCKKVYHTYCLGQEPPEDEYWECPRHSCITCASDHCTYYCQYCPHCYCTEDLPSLSILLPNSKPKEIPKSASMIVCPDCCKNALSACGRGYLTFDDEVVRTILTTLDQGAGGICFHAAFQQLKDRCEHL